MWSGGLTTQPAPLQYVSTKQQEQKTFHLPPLEDEMFYGGYRCNYEHIMSQFDFNRACITYALTH